MKNCVFTIVAKNYIGLAQILEESLKDKNSDVDFFIFVADEFSDTKDEKILAKNIIIAKDHLNISESQWTDMSFKYDLTEFCTSIKPSVFSYFLNNTDYDKIIYLDPDIYIFNSLNPIFEILDNQSIVLTPHITTIQNEYNGDRSESGLLSTGVFNLGFCAIKRSLSSQKMISWWHHRLVNKCYIDSYDSYYTDQKWMDFLPCFFTSEELHVSHHLGMNIAPWNFFEREIFIENDILKVKNREGDSKDSIFPVLFVHYSGYNYSELKKGNVIQNNISKIKEYDDVKLLTDIYAKAIQGKKDLFDKYINEKYSFNFYENGFVIKSFHRRIYRSLVIKGEYRFLNPFSTDEYSLYYILKNKGMMKHSVINLDKITKENLKGVDRKLKIFNVVTRFLYKIIGVEKYLLFIRLLRSFGRYESQIHIVDKKYDNNNIKY